VFTDLGAMLRRRGAMLAARERLTAGLDLAARCGARPLAERARQELLAAGARPRRATIVGTDALTAAERRVARLAADGLSNREIAQALFVTVKTVELHLTSSYRKLRVPGRPQLRAALGSPR
jgi:DNA-binding CsgD family transcriptional regulator